MWLLLSWYETPEYEKACIFFSKCSHHQKTQEADTEGYVHLLVCKTADKSLPAEERPESRRSEWQIQNYQTLEKVEISHRQRCKMVSKEKKFKNSCGT